MPAHVGGARGEKHATDLTGTLEQNKAIVNDSSNTGVFIKMFAVKKADAQIQGAPGIKLRN